MYSDHRSAPLKRKTIRGNQGPSQQGPLPKQICENKVFL